MSPNVPTHWETTVSQKQTQHPASQQAHSWLQTTPKTPPEFILDEAKLSGLIYCSQRKHCLDKVSGALQKEEIRGRHKIWGSGFKWFKVALSMEGSDWHWAKLMLYQFRIDGHSKVRIMKQVWISTQLFYHWSVCLDEQAIVWINWFWEILWSKQYSYLLVYSLVFLGNNFLKQFNKAILTHR